MEFGIIQIIGGSVLIILSILIIILVLMQSKKDQGMTSAISGSSNESFYGKNSMNTREKALERLTKYCAILFFVLAIAVNLLSVFLK
jgi:preprotein translocase subunit SecG